MKRTGITRFVTLMAGVGLMLMLMVSGASAGISPISFTVIDTEVDCAGTASITLTIDVGGSSQIVEVILEVDGVPFGPETIFIGEGSVTETVTFTFPPQTGANVRFEFLAGHGFLLSGERGEPMPTVQSLAVIEKNCATGETVNSRPSDGRFCFAPGEARAAVYSFRDTSGPGIEIWAVDENDKGQRVIRMTADEIGEATVEDELTLLNSSIFNNIKFYRLADGRYQINVGPAGEPKMHVCVFSGIPSMGIVKYTVP